MKGIKTAYVSALLADVAYADLVDGRGKADGVYKRQVFVSLRDTEQRVFDGQGAGLLGDAVLALTTCVAGTGELHGVARVHVNGHSRGGHLATAFARIFGSGGSMRINGNNSFTRTECGGSTIANAFSRSDIQRVQLSTGMSMSWLQLIQLSFNIDSTAGNDSTFEPWRLAA